MTSTHIGSTQTQRQKQPGPRRCYLRHCAMTRRRRTGKMKCTRLILFLCSVGQRLARHFHVIERMTNTLNFLVELVPFTGDEYYIARLRSQWRERSPVRGRRRFRTRACHAGDNLVDNRAGRPLRRLSLVTMTRSAAARRHPSSAAAAVVITAAAEYANQPTTRLHHRTQGAENLLQRVGSVSVIDRYQRLLATA